MLLVDLETAKLHLRLDDDAADEIVIRKVEQASQIIVNYLKLEDPDLWDPLNTEGEAIPLTVEAAVLLVTEALFDGGEPLSQTVKDLVHRYRDPALA